MRHGFQDVELLVHFFIWICNRHVQDTRQFGLDVIFLFAHIQ